MPICQIPFLFPRTPPPKEAAPVHNRIKASPPSTVFPLPSRKSCSSCRTSLPPSFRPFSTFPSFLCLFVLLCSPPLVFPLSLLFSHSLCALCVLCGSPLPASLPPFVRLLRRGRSRALPCPSALPAERGVPRHGKLRGLCGLRVSHSPHRRAARCRPPCPAERASPPQIAHDRDGKTWHIAPRKSMDLVVTLRPVRCMQGDNNLPGKEMNHG